MRRPVVCVSRDVGASNHDLFFAGVCGTLVLIGWIRTCTCLCVSKNDVIFFLGQFLRFKDNHEWPILRSYSIRTCRTSPVWARLQEVTRNQFPSSGGCRWTCRWPRFQVWCHRARTPPREDRWQSVPKGAHMKLHCQKRLGQAGIRPWGGRESRVSSCGRTQTAWPDHETAYTNSSRFTVNRTA